MRLGLLLILSFFHFQSIGQTGFAASYPYQGRAYASTTIGDSMIVTSGRTLGTFGASYCLLLASDLHGEILWQRNHQSNSSFEQWENVQATSDQNLITCGWSVANNEVESDLTVFKFTSQGDSIWLKEYGEVGGYEVGRKIIETNDGFIIFGQTTPANINPASLNAFIMKIDGAGQFVWGRRVDGGFNELFYDGIKTQDGFVAVGESGSNHNDTLDLFVAKFSPTGQAIWMYTYGSTARNEGWSIEEAPNGDLVIAGFSDFHDADSDLMITRLSSTGTHLWSKTYGNGSDQQARDIAITPSGNLHVAGRAYNSGVFTFDGWYLQTDYAGDLISQRAFSQGENTQWEEISFLNEQVLLTGWTGLAGPQFSTTPFLVYSHRDSIPAICAQSINGIIDQELVLTQSNANFEVQPYGQEIYCSCTLQARLVPVG